MPALTKQILLKMNSELETMINGAYSKGLSDTKEFLTRPEFIRKILLEVCMNKCIRDVLIDCFKNKKQVKITMMSGENFFGLPTDVKSPDNDNSVVELDNKKHYIDIGRIESLSIV